MSKGVIKLHFGIYYTHCSIAKNIDGRNGK